MLYTIDLLGAQNLQSSFNISPKVEVFARGCSLTLLGSTPASFFNHPVNPNPVWNVFFRCDFFHCHTIEFHIYHYRPIGFNQKVGFASFSLPQILCPNPVTIPIQMFVPCDVPPTLSFIVIPQLVLFPVISAKTHHNRLFVYTTYSPPIDSSASLPFPVSFKCVAVDKMVYRFSVLDETVDWQLVGKGCFGRLFPGPTGGTLVGMLTRRKIERALVTFILCSTNYTGIVTLNFVLSDAGYRNDIYRTLPNAKTMGLFHQISVPVRPCFAGTIPYVLCLTKSKFMLNPFVTIVLNGNPGLFEMQIALSMLQKPCVRRLIQPRFQDRTIQEMVFLQGVSVPGLINVVFGWCPIKRNDHIFHLSIAVQMYDAQGIVVENMIEKRWRGFCPKRACGRRVSVLSNAHQFARRLGWGRSEYFEDQLNFEIAIDRLPPEIWSISFVGYSRSNYSVHMFKRKFLRIIDPATGTELEMFNYRIEESKEKDVVLIGGLYFAEDLWTFKPSLRLFAVPGGADKIHQATAGVWMEELARQHLLSV
jgi:hypothetical protein